MVGRLYYDALVVNGIAVSDIHTFIVFYDNLLVGVQGQAERQGCSTACDILIRLVVIIPLCVKSGLDVRRILDRIKCLLLLSREAGR